MLNHQKKIYTIFYQDAYKREWGQVGDAILETPTGKVEVVGGVTYLGSEMGTKDAMNPHLHELFHALGFVQLCAPKACLLYTSPSPRDATLSRMPSSA